MNAAPMARALDRETLEEMDRMLLDDEGFLRLVRADTYDRFRREDLRIWAMMRGRYVLPTFELVTWLRGYTALAKSIEIGSGAGDLAKHLRIQGTDSFIQETPEIRAYYERLGQRTTRPGKHVLRMDGVEAVRRFSPSVVVAAWVTQLGDASDVARGINSSPYGVDEVELLSLLRPGAIYIAIGNERVHAGKRLLALPHEEHRPAGLLSRAEAPELDRVWIWKIGKTGGLVRPSSAPPAEVAP